MGVRPWGITEGLAVPQTPGQSLHFKEEALDAKTAAQASTSDRYPCTRDVPASTVVEKKILDRRSLLMAKSTAQGLQIQPCSLYLD
jgi:hypothetical protein